MNRATFVLVSLLAVGSRAWTEEAKSVQNLSAYLDQLQVKLEHSADPVLVRPTTGGLFIGSYVLEIDLVEGHSRWRADGTGFS